MELLEVIGRRRSIRYLKPYKPVEKEKIQIMFEAARIYNEPRYKAAAEKTGVFILLAQMPEPQPAWAQQYDTHMNPVWARSMEPPAVVGRESVSILFALLTLYRETGKKRYLQPVPRAIEYLKSCVYEKNGKPVIARFHELKTNRRLYISPGSPDVRKSIDVGRPNACNQCHLDRSSGWTADHLAQRYGHGRPQLSPVQESVPASIEWLLSGDAGQRALAAFGAEAAGLGQSSAQSTHDFFVVKIGRRTSRTIKDDQANRVRADIDYANAR